MKRTHFLLFLLFLVVFSFRLFFAFHSSTFNTDEAYFQLRSIQTLLTEKHFLSYDPLSYGGRQVLFSPLYVLFFAFTTFGNVVLLKIVPELLLSGLVFIIYQLSFSMTQREDASLFAAALSVFVPLYLWETVNVISSFSLFLPLLFLLFVLFFRLEEHKTKFFFLLVTILLPFIGPAALLFPLTVLFFLFLLLGGALTLSRLKREALLFSCLVIPLFVYLLYASAFHLYGLSLFQQNAPLNVVLDQFRALTPLELILGVGILPLLFGVFGLYVGIHREKNEPVYFVSAFGLAVLTLLILHLIQLAQGLLLLGLAGSILSGPAIVFLFDLLSKTRVHSFLRFFPWFLLLLFFLVSFLPAVEQLRLLNPLPQEMITELSMISQGSGKDLVYAAPLFEGHLITSVAHQQNVVDSNFLLAPHPEERLRDIDTLYHTWSEAKALEIVHKYRITHIYFSPLTQDRLHLSDLVFARTSHCFIQEGHFYVVSC